MIVLFQPKPQQLPSPASSWGSPMQMQPLLPQKDDTELAVKGLNSPGPGNGQVTVTQDLGEGPVWPELP